MVLGQLEGHDRCNSAEIASVGLLVRRSRVRILPGAPFSL